MRIEDAIKLAGGATEAADLPSVNLAKICRDGIQINVKVDKSKMKRKLTTEEEIRLAKSRLLYDQTVSLQSLSKWRKVNRLAN